MNYEIGELERIFRGVCGKKISFILMTGGVLGVIIGIVEAFLPA
jgi:uncharacterized membrane protein YheB (UPF0754 family)